VFMPTLSGKLCVVTGGTRGIGRAIARMLLLEGASVAICGRDAVAVERAVSELATETGGKVKGKAADVREHEQVAGLFRFVDAELGGIDLLVNNAGVGIFGPVAAFSPDAAKPSHSVLSSPALSIEDWKRTVETNLYGVFYASREALARFEIRNGGYIVNISSLAGAHAFAGGAAYNASKFGLTGLSEAMMQDARGANVRVSYVMPGSVATGFGGRGTEAQPEGLDWRIWPEDIAEVVRMLLSMPARTLVSRVEVRPAKPRGGA